MKVDMRKKVEVDVSVIKIHAKCKDMCSYTLVGSDGANIAEGEGYVPDFMPEKHYGDYLILDIDLASGQILNWTPPTKEQLERLINNKTEE